MGVEPGVRFDFPSTFRTPSAPTRQGPQFIGSTDTSGAFALAKELNKLNPEISRTVSNVNNYIIDESKKAGEAWARENEGTYAEAVKNGTLPAGASPFFKRAAHKESLRQQATQFEAQLYEEYETSGELQRMDQEAFHVWMEQRQAEWLKSLPGDRGMIAETVGPTLNAIQQRLGSRHVSESIARTEEQAASQVYTGVRQSIDQISNYDDVTVAQMARDYGITDTRGPLDLRNQVRAAAVQVYADELRQQGFRGSEINSMLADAITQEAVERNDPDLLDLMDYVKGGTGSLSGTKIGREAKERAEDVIDRRLQAEESAAYTRRNRARTIAYQDAMTGILMGLEEDDMGAVEAHLQTIMRVQPTAYEGTQALIDRRLRGEGAAHSDPDTVHEIELTAARGGEISYSRLNELHDAGLLSNADHVRYTAMATEQNEARTQFVMDTEDHVYKSLAPANDIIVQEIGDFEARRQRAAEWAAVETARRYDDILQQNERITYEDKRKIAREVQAEVMALPWVQPLRMEILPEGYAAPTVPAPQEPAEGQQAAQALPQPETPVASPAAPEAQETASPESQERPPIPDEARSILLDNLRRANLNDDPEAWEAIRAGFNNSFGEGAAERIIEEEAAAPPAGATAEQPF